MNSWKATVASTLIAVTFEFTILLFTVNSNRISKVIPIVLAGVSFVFHAWFWEVWEGEPLIRFFKTVVSVVLAYLNYAYAELFIKYGQRGLKFKRKQRPSKNLLAINVEGVLKVSRD